MGKEPWEAPLQAKKKKDWETVFLCCIGSVEAQTAALFEVAAQLCELSGCPHSGEFSDSDREVF